MNGNHNHDKRRVVRDLKAIQPRANPRFQHDLEDRLLKEFQEEPVMDVNFRQNPPRPRSTRTLSVTLIAALAVLAVVIVLMFNSDPDEPPGFAALQTDMPTDEMLQQATAVIMTATQQATPQSRHGLFLPATSIIQTATGEVIAATQAANPSSSIINPWCESDVQWDRVHIYSEGETFLDIAERYNVGYTRLTRVNCIVPGQPVQAGDAFRIPLPGGTAEVSLPYTPIAGQTIIEEGDMVDVVAILRERVDNVGYRTRVVYDAEVTFSGEQRVTLAVTPQEGEILIGLLESDAFVTFLLVPTDIADPLPPPLLTASPIPDAGAQVTAVAPPTAAFASIVMATRQIERGEVITEDALRVETFPAIAVPPDALTSIEDVVGRVARVTLYENQLVLAQTVDETVVVLPSSTPSANPTATPTPPATFLCRVEVDENITLRSQPTTQGARLAALAPGQELEVIAQQTDSQDVLWYRVQTLIDDIPAEGWVRADTVEVVGAPCPALPD